MFILFVSFLWIMGINFFCTAFIPCIGKAFLRPRLATVSFSTQKTNSDSQELFQEDSNNFSEPSSLYASEVSDYGVCTALAEEHIRLGNHEEAIKLLEEAIQIGHHTGQMNNVFSAYAEGLMGDALFAEGDYKEASIRYRDALKTYENHFYSVKGPESVELMGALQVTAWNLVSKKQFQAAKRACAEALGLSKKLFGTNSTTVATAMVNLANVQMKTGEIGPSPELFIKNAISILKSHQKQHHSAISSSSSHAVAQNTLDRNMALAHLSLGELYTRQGRPDMAMRQFVELLSFVDNGAISETEAAFGLQELALIRWRNKELKSAEQLLARLLFAFETKEGVSDACYDHYQQILKLREHLHELRNGVRAPESEWNVNASKQSSKSGKSYSTNLFVKNYDDHLQTMSKIDNTANLRDSVSGFDSTDNTAADLGEGSVDVWDHDPGLG